MKVATEKRCGCRGDAGRQLGKSCPRLRQKGHGAWAWRVRMPEELVGLAGKRFVRGSGLATQREAQAAGETLVARLRAGQQITGALTVGQYLEEWLATKRRLRPTARRSYEGHLRNHLVPHLGTIPLDRLRPVHIGAAYDAIVATTADHIRPVGPATIARIHATLRSALNAAVKQRLLPFNPALHVDLPEVDRHRAEPWSAAELGRFLDAAAADRLGAMYELMALVGLRRGETVGLRWSDVDLDRGVLTIRQQHVDVGGTVVVGKPKTTAGERVVDLDAGTTGTLLAHRLVQDTERTAWGEAYTDHGLVFCREDGSPLRPEYVTRHMQRIAERAGLPRKRLHDLRHGSASLQLAAGVPLPIVSKRLGHSSVSITADTYSHLLDGVGRQAAEATRALVPRSPHGAGVPTTCPPEPTDDSPALPGGANPQVSGGGPPGTRTQNPRIKSPLLCQLS